MAHGTTSSSLAAQFQEAIPVILSNGWVDQARIEAAQAEALTAPDPIPMAGRSLLAQFLVERRVLSREQASDLDALLLHQGYLRSFKLRKKIGSGGMGTVFLATHVETGREVALKTINARLAEDGDFVSRFHREAKALSSVRHPNIAEIIEAGEKEGHCWLAMEYIDGPSLMALLKDHRGALPELYCLRIALQVAEGLAHVWSTAGLVHRDIKPENVLILRSREGGELFPASDVAKLIDFGLVKSNQEDERLTQTGMTIGTPLYMSPEQVRGEKLDCRSDVYGLGATLFHLLTGVTPFNGNSPGAIMSAHLTEPAPDPGDRVPSLNTRTRELVMMSMAKKADDRFRDFPGFIAAARRIIEDLDGRQTEFPKLLRKPMVLKNPVKRSGEWRVDGESETRPAESQAAATASSSASDALAKVQTDRQLRKPPTEPVRRPQVGLPGGVEPAKPGTGRAPGSGNRPGTDVVAAQKPGSDRVAAPRPPTTRNVSKRPGTEPHLFQGGEKDALEHRVDGQAPPPALSIPRPGTEPLRSAAFAEDRKQTGGIGLVPWLVLGSALIILTLGLVIGKKLEWF